MIEVKPIDIGLTPCMLDSIINGKVYPLRRVYLTVHSDQVTCQ